jgi:hypothetical protein
MLRVACCFFSCLSQQLTTARETASLTPSIWDYVQQHGRTYHRYMAGGKHTPGTLLTNHLES